MKIERWLMKESMHLGPLRDELKDGQIIEWVPELLLMKVDGKKVDKNGADPEEAMRMLKALAGKNPENPCITELPAHMTEPGEGTLEPPKTQTSTMLPVLGCFKAAGEFIGKPLEFEAINNAQGAFLALFQDKLPEVDKLTEELKSLADKDVGVINAFLKEHGFDIQLDPVSDGFAVASILDVLVKWLGEGKKTTIRNGNYPAVKLKEGVSIFMGPHGNPLVAVETKSGDIVFMTVVDEVPEDVFAVQALVDQMTASKATPWRGNNKGVIFPMVNYDQQIDISWLCGLKVHPEWYVQQALQQTKFRMNEIGARAQSAVAMTMRCASAMAEPKPIVIDRPFLLWIDRQGVDTPLFSGIFAEDVWEEPEGLD
jgi:hypothetical protein